MLGILFVQCYKLFLEKAFNSHLSIGYHLPPCLDILNKTGISDLKINSTLHMEKPDVNLHSNVPYEKIL